MRWFRDNVRHGSWLALVAIAINLALSFGHIHIAGQVSDRGLIAAVLGASDHGKAPGQVPSHPGDPQTDDLCPICLASSAIANAMASAPPALPLRLDATAVDRPIALVRIAVTQPRAAFQSRGPPLS